MQKISVLEFIQKMIRGESAENFSTHFLYPTAISKTLHIHLVAVSKGEATVSIHATEELHGNQQGTVHGGLICELADAAIGTAHSTLVEEGETFTTLELKINFFRPTWNDILYATAKPVQSGKTITVYQCEVKNTSEKVVALISSTVMTLRGDKAKGR